MSNLSTSLPSVTGYDSVGSTEPADKEAGTTWYDTSVPTGKVYTGTQWVEESAPAGGSGITLSGGQYDVATGDGLTISAGAVALLLSADLTIDVNGDIAVASNAVDAGQLSFDPATQTELNNHAGSSGVHHTRYTDSEAASAAGGKLAEGSVNLNYNGQHTVTPTSSSEMQFFTAALWFGNSGGFNFYKIYYDGASWNYTRQTNGVAKIASISGDASVTIENGDSSGAHDVFYSFFGGY